MIEWEPQNLTESTENNIFPPKIAENSAETIGQIYVNSLRNAEKRREYKVPARITQLPCGCKRERGAEVSLSGDVSTITWTIARKKNIYRHTGCGKTLLDTSVE